MTRLEPYRIQCPDKDWNLWVSHTHIFIYLYLSHSHLRITHTLLFIRFLKPMQIKLISQLKGSIPHQILDMIGVKERGDLIITIPMESDVQK